MFEDLGGPGVLASDFAVSASDFAVSGQATSQCNPYIGIFCQYSSAKTQ